jgi:HSP20 family protein
MTLVRLNNWMPELSNIMNNVFDRTPYGNELTHYSAGMSPAVNILENENEFVLELVAPGMKKEDFKIELNNQLLTVSAEKEEANESTDNYRRREFNIRSIKRSFTLPKHIVDENRIEAHYEAGILKLMIGKKEEAKPKPVRTINIA